MPTRGAALQSFELERVDYLAPEAGGRVGAVTAGEPLWAGMWQLGKMGAAASDEWRAWRLRLRGSQRGFLARDVARPYPLAHITGFAGMTRAGGGAFSGATTGWSQTIDAEGDASLQISGLPATLAFSWGDYIGFRWDAVGDPAGTMRRRALVRVVVPGLANGSGVAVLRVEPPVPTLVVPPTAIAHLDTPACVMRLVPGGSDFGPIDRRLSVTNGRISAIQDLRP